LRKWINWVALVLVFAVACGFLSNWQFNRREQKLASIQLVQNNYSSNPVALEDLLIGGSFQLPKDTWRQVKVSGHYLPEKFQLVRNRPNDGQPGFEQLVPFVTDKGQTIFVSRGWIPTGQTHDYPDEVALPSNEETSIIARVLASEPKLNRTAPIGQLASINLELARVATDLPDAISSGYLRLASEEPMVGKKLVPMPSPSTEEGNNLSYAIQWILFALMAAGALIWRIKKDAELARGEVRPKKLRRSDLDAQFEDETTKAK
jgi:cytochrome oxidase assembly protein ShyY1